MKKEVTLKEIKKAIKVLKTATNKCPQCGKIFSSNPKDGGYVIFGGVAEIWCKKCYEDLEK